MRRRSSNDKKAADKEEGDSDRHSLEDELSSQVEEDESQYTLRTAKNPSTKAGNPRASNKTQQSKMEKNAKKGHQPKNQVEAHESSNDISGYFPNELDVNPSEEQDQSDMREISKGERFTQERIIPRQEYVQVKDVGIQVDLASQSQNIKILQIREENGMELIDVLEFGHLRSYKREYMEENHIKSLIRFYESISRCSIGVSLQTLEDHQ